MFPQQFPCWKAALHFDRGLGRLALTPAVAEQVSCSDAPPECLTWLGFPSASIVASTLRLCFHSSSSASGLLVSGRMGYGHDIMGSASEALALAAQPHTSLFGMPI